MQDTLNHIDITRQIEKTNFPVMRYKIWFMAEQRLHFFQENQGQFSLQKTEMLSGMAMDLKIKGNGGWKVVNSAKVGIASLERD